MPIKIKEHKDMTVLQYIRKRRGLKQEDIINSLQEKGQNISTHHYSQLERNVLQTFSVELAMAIAKTFNIQVEDFVEFEEPANEEMEITPDNYTKLPYYIKKEIGKGLKEIRNEKKILAEDAGEKIGIKAKNKAEPIYHLENGHGSKKRVEALCELYGTTLEDVLNDYAYEAIRKKLR